jgi:hypothetical protein
MRFRDLYLCRISCTFDSIMYTLPDMMLKFLTSAVSTNPDVPTHAHARTHTDTQIYNFP